MGKTRNAQIANIEAAVDEAARRWFSKDRGHTMKGGREDDLSIPADKRRDSYGKSIINRGGPRMTVEGYENFADQVDAGNSNLDPHHRNAARMHTQSLRGHDRADAISKAAIKAAVEDGRRKK